MKEIILDGILALAVTGFLFYVVFLACWLIDNRARWRVLCECGHKEKAYSLSTAKWSATEHMMRCKGKAIVSPLPARDIAEAAEK